MPIEWFDRPRLQQSESSRSCLRSRLEAVFLSSFSIVKRCSFLGIRKKTTELSTNKIGKVGKFISFQRFLKKRKLLFFVRRMIDQMKSLIVWKLCDCVCWDSFIKGKMTTSTVFPSPLSSTLSTTTTSPATTTVDALLKLCLLWSVLNKPELSRRGEESDLHDLQPTPVVRNEAWAWKPSKIFVYLMVSNKNKKFASCDSKSMNLQVSRRGN